MQKGSGDQMTVNSEKHGVDTEIYGQNNELEQKIEISLSEYARLKEQEDLAKRYLRNLRQLQADFENFRRIMKRSKEQAAKFGNEQLVKKLLLIQDDLIRAIQYTKDPDDDTVTLEDYTTLRRGLLMIQDNLLQILESEGVQPIEAIGKSFDPYEHEVLLVEETTECPDGTCLEELERGYYYKDKVIRPAKVKTARNNKKLKQMIKIK